MRCKDVEAILVDAREETLSGSVRAHLSGCSGCRETWKDLRLLRAGFNALAEDPAPEASLGFGSRVVRRLESAIDSGGAAAEFVEKIGRRFVLASLVLTMSLLLIFALPSSGPLRGPASDEPYITQSEASAPSEVSILGYEFTDAHDSPSVNLSNGSGEKQK